MDKAAEAVRAAIMNGIDLIREGAGVDVTAVTFITQICATIVLFLFVRFFFWNKVTGILEKREELVMESLKKREEAVAEVASVQEKSAQIIEEAKNDAASIKQQAILEANSNRDTIIGKAKSDAAQLEKETTEKLEEERNAMQEDIKQEIIEVAYQLAEKIVEANIDKTKNEELVKQFFEEQADGKRS